MLLSRLISRPNIMMAKVLRSDVYMKKTTLDFIHAVFPRNYRQQQIQGPLAQLINLWTILASTKFIAPREEYLKINTCLLVLYSHRHMHRSGPYRGAAPASIPLRPPTKGRRPPGKCAPGFESNRAVRGYFDVMCARY